MQKKSQNDLQTLARRLGVSVSTISRVLSGKAEEYRISAATQERVLKAANKSRVVVNHVARGLRLKTTQTVGLIIPDISNPFFASLARQVERYARTRGYFVLLADSQERTDVEIESLQLMLSRRVDGLIVAPVGESSDHLEIAARNRPMVLVDRIFPSLNVASVTADNFEGTLLAVQHFAQRGHTEIACVQGVSNTYVNAERLRGYREGLMQARLKFCSSFVVGADYTIEGGRNAVQKLFAGAARPTAIVALGNLIALGALQSLQTLRLRVPEDVSIISFDEQPWAGLLAPAITTISQPIEEMGKRAMELLFGQLDQSAKKSRNIQRISLPVSLVERDSVFSLKRR